MSIFSKIFKQPFLKKTQIWVVGALVSAAATLLLFLILFFVYYQQRIYQGVYVCDINIGGLTKNEALTKLEPLLTKEPNQALLIATQSAQTHQLQKQIEVSNVVAGWNQEEVLAQALKLGHDQPFLAELKTILNLLKNERSLSLVPLVDKEKLTSEISPLKNEIDLAAQEPSMELATSGVAESLKVDPGQNGQKLDLEATTRKAIKLIQNKNNPCSLTSDFSQQSPETSTSSALIEMKPVVKEVEVELTNSEIESLKARATNILNKKLIFKADLESIQTEQYSQARNLQFELNDQQLISLMGLTKGYNQQELAQLVSDWAKKIDQEPKNAVFSYDPETLVVEEFIPPKKGVALEQKQAKQAVLAAISGLEQESQKKPDLSASDQGSQAQPTPEAENDSTETENGDSTLLPITPTEPATTLAETNNLGINSLIGFGDSYYAHSIPARIHNVKITAEKLSLHIVPPGEEFSFNQAIGKVSAQTGYRPAYVIKNGRTILGEGGGVCQVSTTLFRALLDSGLKITKRLPHSYRVSYYELDNQPGFDATAYAGEVDLRFANDTNHHLLIYSEANSDDLYMKVEIYGTDDGRTTEISNYQKWDYQPPPPPEYIPSTDIPPGQTKQIDWAVSGIKTSFDWTVKDKSGEIIREKTYYSNYRPWSAKYLQGVESLP